ncbi:MAG: hypothetical protein HYU67_02940 [Flavobacteriia bacterium]|nr:hypothetical protein [Flavobacteriia bacterium]
MAKKNEIKWIGERISFLDDEYKTTIVIRPNLSPWIKAVYGAWISMWITIGIVVFYFVFSQTLTNKEQIILFVFLSFWSYYAYRVGKQFLWIMWGQERFKINESAFSIKKSYFNYGKAQSYLLQNINKLRGVDIKENSLQSVWESSPWIGGGERFEFDYLGKVVRFGRKLNSKEQHLLFQVITKRIQDNLRKNSK